MSNPNWYSKKKKKKRCKKIKTFLNLFSKKKKKPMSITSVSLVNRELSFTPYDIKWIPCSSRVCTVGATNHGTGKIAVYNLVGKQLELKTEVLYQTKLIKNSS